MDWILLEALPWHNYRGNQNAVFEFQFRSTKYPKSKFRASIQDSNIPLQDGGYSQKLGQFDNVRLTVMNGTFVRWYFFSKTRKPIPEF
jgi:hypothetical protein